MAQTLQLIPAQPRHYPEILALNEELVHFLAPMDEALLCQFKAMATLLHVVELEGQVAALVIALDSTLDYESENYSWFRARYQDFLYIDRIAIDPKFHRRGIGAFIYQEIFATAKAMGYHQVTAEVNSQPANLVSLDFHAAMGFTQVGTQFVCGGEKQVAMQLATI